MTVAELAEDSPEELLRAVRRLTEKLRERRARDVVPC
jgi:hypothetical protein